MSSPTKKISQQEKIQTLLKSNTLMVLSTTNSRNQSQSALVAFTQTENFEIIFGTFCTTRKYANLKCNPSVSIVIGLDERLNKTIQIEGTAQEAATLLQAKEWQSLQLKKNPASKKYASHQHQRYFKITPAWMRYSDFSKTTEEIFEVHF